MLSMRILQRLGLGLRGHALVRLFDLHRQLGPVGPNAPRFHLPDVRPDMDAGQAVRDPLIGKAPVVDPRSHAVQLQGVVTHGRPGRPGGLKPRPVLAESGFPRPAGPRLLALVRGPPEPRFRGPVVSVVHPFRDQAMGVRVPLFFMHGQQVRQALGIADARHELMGQPVALRRWQLMGQGEFDFAEERGLGPLVGVRGLPIPQGIVRPCGHVPAGDIGKLVAVGRILLHPQVVRGLGACALASGLAFDDTPRPGAASAAPRSGPSM
jgi:hypothetical protein